MDPDACWKEFVGCMKEHDWEGAIEHLENLVEWRSKGGFLPKYWVLPEGVFDGWARIAMAQLRGKQRRAEGLPEDMVLIVATEMTGPHLDEVYRLLAHQCIDEGIENDADPNGAIHEWVERNCEYREGTEFFIVLGISCAMREILAGEGAGKHAGRR